MNQEEIALWGKITAGISHEMNNVLAIINESNGLMQDIMKSGKKAPIKYQDKMVQAMEKINRQINRGVEISNSLNRFAHSTDEATKNISPNEISNHVNILLQRFARQKDVELEYIADEQERTFSSNPFRLTLTLAGIIYHLLDKTQALKKICLRSHVQDGQVRFGIELVPSPERSFEGVPHREYFSFLGNALKDLGAELHSDGNNGFQLSLSI